MNIKRKELEDRFFNWLDDDKWVKKINETVEHLGGDWIIVEQFVGDFTARKKLLNTEGLYMRYTPYAKVLKVGAMCTDWYADLQPGDIVTLNDSVSFQILNPRWEQWYEQQGRTTEVNNNGAPQKYIKGVDTYVTEFLYHPDKFALCTSQELMGMSAEKIANYRGPFIFKVPQRKIETKQKDEQWA